MLMATVLLGEAIIRATVNSTGTTQQLKFSSGLQLQNETLWSFPTFGGPGALCSDDVRVTPELLQAGDGALAHHGLPTKRPVVNHLEHDGRCVHLVLWQ